MGNARFGVEHANAHLSELERILQAFCQEDGWLLAREPDPLHASHDLLLIKPRPIPPRVAGLVGDALVNLRSALDHVGHAVAIAAGTKGRSAHFPFGDTLAEAQSRRMGGSKGLPAEIFDLMLAFKPYRGGNNSLWSLNKLANRRKHEALLYVDLDLSQMVVSRPGLGLKTGPLKDRRRGNEDLLVAWPRRGESMRETRFHPAVTVRFQEAGSLPHFRNDAPGELRTMSGIVASVIASVDAEARRLGIFGAH